jgi:hypothetical protein
MNRAGKWAYLDGGRSRGGKVGGRHPINAGAVDWFQGGRPQLAPSPAPLYFAPVLLRLPFDRRCCRVLGFDPGRRAARDIARAPALRDDALAAERSGVLVDGHAVTLDVFAQVQGLSKLEKAATKPGVKIPKT